MATQTKTFYDKSDTLNDLLNPELLKQEIVDAGAVPGQENLLTADSVTPLGTTFSVNFLDLLDDADILVVDGLVAAHTGEAFGSSVVREKTNATSSDSTNDWIDMETLSTGLLKAGWYQYSVTCEMRLDDELTSGGRIETQVLLTTKAETDSETDKDVWLREWWHKFTTGDAIQVEDGDFITLKLQFRARSGAPASCRRARLSVIPAPGDA